MEISIKKRERDEEEKEEEESSRRSSEIPINYVWCDPERVLIPPSRYLLVSCGIHRCTVYGDDKVCGFVLCFYGK
jgi:hypothetical protein